MDQIAITAASGLHARMEALDLVANNLANATTGGFKLDREFYSLFSASDDTGMKGTPSPNFPSSRSNGPISAKACFSPQATLSIWP